MSVKPATGRRAVAERVRAGHSCLPFGGHRRVDPPMETEEYLRRASTENVWTVRRSEARSSTQAGCTKYGDFYCDE